MLYIHGAAPATCTQRVLVSLLAMGLAEGKDFELVVADFGNLKSPEWLAKHPFGQMPYLEDDSNGLVVYESRAIIRYVAAKIQSPLLVLPGDGVEAYAKFETAALVEINNFDPYAYGVVSQLIFAPMRGGQPDHTVIVKNKEILESKLPILDKILGQHKYAAGDKMTVVDFAYLPYGSMLAQTGVVPGMTDGSLPNFKCWWEEMSAHPSWKKVEGMKAEALAKMRV